MCSSHAVHPAMLSLVTSGAGFLGSHLVDALLECGDEVIIADDLRLGSLQNIDDALATGRATFVYLDVLRSPTSLRDLLVKAARFQNVDRIFHLGPPVGADVGGFDLWNALASEAVLTITLVEFALEQRARLIYASRAGAATAYTSEERRTEFYRREAQSFGETALAVATACRGLDGRRARVFNCYGPRMSKWDSRLMAALDQAAASRDVLLIDGDGSQIRSMTFVDDAVALILKLANSPMVPSDTLDIGSEEEYTVLGVAMAYARVVGQSFTVEHREGELDDSSEPAPDLSLARSLGCVPMTSLQEGLAKTISWRRRNEGLYV